MEEKTIQIPENYKYPNVYSLDYIEYDDKKILIIGDEHDESKSISFSPILEDFGMTENILLLTELPPEQGEMNYLGGVWGKNMNKLREKIKKNTPINEARYEDTRYIKGSNERRNTIRDTSNLIVQKMKIFDERKDDVVKHSIIRTSNDMKKYIKSSKKYITDEEYSKLNRTLNVINTVVKKESINSNLYEKAQQYLSKIADNYKTSLWNDMETNFANATVNEKKFKNIVIHVGGNHVKPIKKKILESFRSSSL